MDRLSLFVGVECFLFDSLVSAQTKALEDRRIIIEIERVSIVLNMNNYKISKILPF
jgi:hypothetical protein